MSGLPAYADDDALYEINGLTFIVYNRHDGTERGRRKPFQKSGFSIHGGFLYAVAGVTIVSLVLPSWRPDK